ncbi:MAG: hypothetical protein V1793_25065 [Pseudomonadota bacterium]
MDSEKKITTIKRPFPYSNQHYRRSHGFQAKWPNQLHHVDASCSKFLYIQRELGDGNYVLRLHAVTQECKNKPVPIRLRPWLYILVDDYSDVFVGRYVASYGESNLENLDFLVWAWGDNGNTHLLTRPEKIKGDKGPMMRGKDAQDFFSRLGVDIDETMPGNKEAGYKIERLWRAVWDRFEKPLFERTDRATFEITLSELNARFMAFSESILNKIPEAEKSAFNRHIPIDTDAQEGPIVEASDSKPHDYRKMKADGMTDQLLVKHLRKDLEDHGLPISAAFARNILIETGVIVPGSDTGKFECETQN